jgi:hypothetical protein
MTKMAQGFEHWLELNDQFAGKTVKSITVDDLVHGLQITFEDNSFILVLSPDDIIAFKGAR